MKALSSEERWALDVLAGPGRQFDGKDGGEGSRPDSLLPSLIERKCVVWRHDGRGGVDVGLSDLGHLARRADDAAKARRSR